MKKDKSKEIDDMPAPKNIKQLRSLLGMLNYYSRFCPNYALVVAPLYDLLRKNRKWAWEIEHQKAFNEVKAMFRNSCVIAHPDFSKPMILQTDSSAYGIAAVLLQKQGEEYKIIQLVSKSLRGPQLRYSVTEKEAYGVVWSVMKLRQYLTGRTFIIRTDHKSLTFLNRCFTENDRLKRWIIWLQQFDFQIQHCPGRENKLPDFLSRYGREVEDKSRAETRLVVAPIDLKVPQQLQWEWSNVIAWQEQDENMAEIKRIKEGRAYDSPLKQQHDQDPEKWHVVDGLLTIRVRRQPPTYRIWIPKSKVDDLIGYVHCKNAHYGANKILIHIQELCYWKGMARDVRRVVSKCNTCLTTKYPNRKYAGAMHNIIPARRNDLLAIDIYGPLPRTTNGNKYVLVMIDVFSKFTRMYPINKTNASNCLRQIEKHLEIAGTYSRILSDHGTQFTSTKYQDALREKGITPIYSSIRHPQSNPSERVMKELSRLFRTYCSENHSEWNQLIPYLNIWMNRVHHDSIGTTPWEAHFGRKPPHTLEMLDREEVTGNPPVVTDEQILQKLRQSGEERKRKEKKKPYQFIVNQQVLLRTPRTSNPQLKLFAKFFKLYEGPYEIQNIIAPNVARLVNQGGEIIGDYNFYNLRPV